MFHYDPDFSPPAPMLEITVHHPKTAGLETEVRAQLDPGSDAILGRDVLNHFILTLNGKDLTFELQDP